MDKTTQQAIEYFKGEICPSLRQIAPNSVANLVRIRDKYIKNNYDRPESIFVSTDDYSDLMKDINMSLQYIEQAPQGVKLGGITICYDPNLSKGEVFIQGPRHRAGRLFNVETKW